MGSLRVLGAPERPGETHYEQVGGRLKSCFPYSQIELTETNRIQEEPTLDSSIGTELKHSCLFNRSSSRLRLVRNSSRSRCRLADHVIKCNILIRPWSHGATNK